jgi:hypothetical protein
VAGIRLDPGKFVRPFKGIFCDDFLSSSPTNSATQSVSLGGSGGYLATSITRRRRTVRSRFAGHCFFKL